MSLQLNSLLEISAEDNNQECVRVIYVDRRSNSAFVIRIDRSDVLPEERQLSELEEGLAENRIRVLPVDPFAYLQMPEESIPLKHRRRRDAAWAIIESIVTAPNHAALESDSRGQLIRVAMQKAGGTKKHIYRYLRRYWQAGLTRNALLPYFHLCGARGKERKAGNSKRGRPRCLTQLRGAPPGVNVGPIEAEKLRKGYRLFYRKTGEDGGQTLKSAHRETLRKFFHVGFTRRDGTLVEVLPPADELPTFAQFLYWARKGEDVNDRIFRRNGERKFNLTLRPVLGDSTTMAYGPGVLYQIDATITDFWAVSSLNRARRLARLTTYFVVDTFSHLIVGFHVGLENPSFFAAGLALENAITDKVAYCAKFRIEIAPEEWPSMGLAIYGFLHKQAVGDWPAGTYFILNSGRMLAQNKEYFPHAYSIPARSGAEGLEVCWNEFVEMWHYRRALKRWPTWPTPAFMAPLANRLAKCSRTQNSPSCCPCQQVCFRCLKRRPVSCMAMVMWN